MPGATWRSIVPNATWHPVAALGPYSVTLLLHVENWVTRVKSTYRVYYATWKGKFLHNAAALLQCCKIAAGMSDTRINLVQLINYGDGEYETLLKIAERAVADGMSAIMAQAPGSPPFRASLGLSFEQFYACENLFRHVLLRLCKASERDSRSTEEGLSQEARDFARINDFVNKIALELTLHVDSAVAGILLAGNTYNDEDVDWAGICTQVAHARMAGAEFTGGLESMGLEAMQLMM